MTAIAKTDQQDSGQKVPDGWRQVRLAEVCRVVSGSTPSSGVADNWDGDIVWITPTDLGKHKNVSIAGSFRRITKLGYDSCGTELVPPGSVVLSSRAPIGHLGIARVPLCTNQGCKSLVPGLEVDSQFLFFVIKKSIPILQALGSGATFAEISKTQVEGFPIPLPPFEEQKRIAAILNEQMAAVERARAAAEAQLEAAKALSAANLHAVFSSPEAQRWPRKRLGELAIKGPDNGAFKRRHQFGQGVPIVNVSDLFRSLAVDLNSVERVETSDDEIQSYGIASGDLFFCRSSLKREGIGWCCYVNEVLEPAIFDCHVMRVRLDQQKVLPEYVALYWAHPRVREAVIGNSRTATMTTMNQGDLAGVDIPLPPLQEQRRAAAHLLGQMAAAEQTRTALEAQLATINALPAALLRRAFNGEL